jgi:hypothetical protein
MKESTLVTLNKVVLMEMESLNIMMVPFMRENGTITNSMDLVNINWLMEEFI